MADIVNIYNRHVYQHNRKRKMRKSKICNLRNLKITVIFWSHFVLFVKKLFPRKYRREIRKMHWDLIQITNIFIFFTHEEYLCFSRTFLMVSWERLFPLEVRNRIQVLRQKRTVQILKLLITFQLWH